MQEKRALAIEKSILENKLIVLSESLPAWATCALGFWVQTGTRWDPPGQGGLAHFLEHMLFKGTKERTPLRLAQDMDLLGGSMNAFTEQEQTCFYTVVLGEDLEAALEILSDMLLNSTLEECELERERGVIIEEIKMVEDDPQELASDLFYATLWPHHPLGAPIQGTVESVQALNRSQLWEFKERYYQGANIIVAAAGAVEHGSLVELCQRYLGQLPAGAAVERTPGGAPQPHPGRTLRRRPTEQVSLCCGWQTIAQDDPRRFEAAILDSALGGSLSCSLFQEIREKSGLAYSVETFRSAYRDAGLFGVEVGASPAKVEAVLAAIDSIFASIRREGISADELERAIKHIKSSYALSLETTFGRMGKIVQNERLYGRQVELAELYAQLELVDRERIVEFARQFFRPQDWRLAIVGPLED